MIKYILLIVVSFSCSAVFGQRYLNVPVTDSLKLLRFQQKVNIPAGINQSLMTRKVFEYEISPLFCKIEHKMNRKNRIPVYFRLGSKDYVDRMEGK